MATTRRKINLEDLKKVLIDIVIESRTEVTLCMLENKYKEKTKENLPYAELGYRDSFTMIRDKMAGTLVMDTSYNTRNPTIKAIVSERFMSLHQAGYRSRLTKSNYIFERYFKMRIDTVLMYDLSIRIRRLLEEYTDGIWCADLDELYREKYGIPIAHLRVGFRSIFALVRGMSTIVRIERKDFYGDCKLFRVEYPLEPRESPYHSDVFSDNTDDTFETDDFPSDCMQRGQIIQRVSVSDLKVGQQIEVDVTNVYSPSHLWMQRKNDLNFVHYVEMIEEMNEYYDGIGSMRYLSKAAIQNGHYCCAIYEGNWQRTVIVDILGEGHYVKVRFIDLGCVEIADVRTLRVLQNKWSTLPAIALRARLAKLKPISDHILWSTEATLHLKNLTAQGKFLAEIALVDPVAMEIWVHIQSDIDWINNELLWSGKADQTPMPVSRLRFFEFPLFEAIEEAKTLSFDEIVEFQESYINLNDIPKYTNYIPPWASAVIIHDGSNQSRALESSSVTASNNSRHMKPLEAFNVPTLSEHAHAILYSLSTPIQLDIGLTLVFKYEDLVKYQQLNHVDPTYALGFMVALILEADVRQVTV